MGRATAVRRWIAQAQAQELTAFVVPGMDVARAHGLDLAAAGLRVAPTPRHAAVLILVGDLSPGLRQAAAVVYAQMPRPRTICALGCTPTLPLPVADVTAALSQSALITAVPRIRKLVRSQAWQAEATPFDALAATTAGDDRTPDTHTHGGHAQAESRPGRGERGAAHDGHDHTSDNQVESTATAAHTSHGTTGWGKPQGGHRPGDPAPTMDAGHDHHPNPKGEHTHCTDSAGHGTDGHEDLGGREVARRSHASTTREQTDHGAMDHAGMEHMDHTAHGGGFMSMVMMTQDQPRSPDGLVMDRLRVPFGPLFPGLPGGLALNFTLDGDAVAQAEVNARPVERALSATWPGPAETFQRRFSNPDPTAPQLDPLTPLAYRLLAQRALQQATGTAPSDALVRGQIGALEWQRAVSHLNWLAGVGALLGDRPLETRAAALGRTLLHAGTIDDVKPLIPEIGRFSLEVLRLPLLRRRLSGVGRLHETEQTTVLGPVARASGYGRDSRSTDPAYVDLGFTCIVEDGGDAYARLQVRLREVAESLNLVAACNTFHLPQSPHLEHTSGNGTAIVETPRGCAVLHLALAHGAVQSAVVETPSARNATAVPLVTHDLEVGDALAAIVSLDLSPWEMAC